MQQPFLDRVDPRPLRRAAGLVATALLVAACGGTSTTAAPTEAANLGGSGAAINVNEADFKIEPSATTAAPGPVTFHVTNSGTQVHEFVVLKTDVAGDQLPTSSDGTEVEEEGLTVVDEAEDIAVGASVDLAVTLDAGHYVLLCNVPGHYMLGMRADFTVGP